MYTNFENLPEEKKQRIIDAALEEFAWKGYEKASTNEIVKQAGISKGILFHYFGSKKNLYLYIVDYTVEYPMKRFKIDETEMEADIFERLMNWGVRKLQIANENPAMYRFVVTAFRDTPNELKKEMKEKYERYYASMMPLIFKNIDTSLFRKDIDHRKAIELIILSLNALGDKYIEAIILKPDKGLSDMSTIMNEMREYMDILKRGIYG